MDNFEKRISLLENDKYKVLAKGLLTTIPEYFYKVPASSSGKYHPDYAQGEGGLYRHTIAACMILDDLFEAYINIDSRERDLCRIAMIMHDTRKCGTQEEYEKDSHTKFLHPNYARDVVDNFYETVKDKEEYKYISYFDIITISSIISTHMGKFNKKEGYPDLQEPVLRLNHIVHIADLLASRKDISVKFNEEEI